MIKDPITILQHSRLTLRRDAPLVVVDADEVLVYFLRHFRDHVAQIGWTLDLTEMRLDRALRQSDSGRIADRPEALRMLDAFFASQTHAQQPIPDAADVLTHLAKRAQIVVLTNIPHASRDARIGNLERLGHRWPVLTNSGGKGPVLAALAARVDGPVIFIDDSASQIESAAKHAPDVQRVQLIGCDWAVAYLPRRKAAHHVATSWREAAGFLDSALDA